MNKQEYIASIAGTVPQELINAIANPWVSDEQAKDEVSLWRNSGATEYTPYISEAIKERLSVIHECYDNFSEYSEEQIEAIKETVNADPDDDYGSEDFFLLNLQYFHPSFSVERMYTIAEAINEDVNLELIGANYSDEQAKNVCNWLIHNKHNEHEYQYDEEEKLCRYVVNDKNTDYHWLYKAVKPLLRYLIDRDINISDFSDEQFKFVVDGLIGATWMSKYTRENMLYSANPLYSVEQIKEIQLGAKQLNRCELSLMREAEFTAEEMRQIRYRLQVYTDTEVERWIRHGMPEDELSLEGESYGDDYYY